MPGMKRGRGAKRDMDYECMYCKQIISGPHAGEDNADSHLTEHSATVCDSEACQDRLAGQTIDIIRRKFPDISDEEYEDMKVAQIHGREHPRIPPMFTRMRRETLEAEGE